MRSEKEMMESILGFAQARDDVHAVVMTGSRADPAAPPEHVWDALFAMGEAFRKAARPLAEEFGFAYLDAEDGAVSAFVRELRVLGRT